MIWQYLSCCCVSWIPVSDSDSDFTHNHSNSHKTHVLYSSNRTWSHCLGVDSYTIKAPSFLHSSSISFLFSSLTSLNPLNPTLLSPLGTCIQLSQSGPTDTHAVLLNWATQARGEPVGLVGRFDDMFLTCFWHADFQIIVLFYFLN